MNARNLFLTACLLFGVAVLMCSPSAANGPGHEEVVGGLCPDPWPCGPNSCPTTTQRATSPLVLRSAPVISLLVSVAFTCQGAHSAP